MKHFVIDTNVAITANGKKTPQANINCVLSCIDTLQNIINNEKFCVDDNGLIFKEYLKYLNPSGQPGPGDMFMKWVHVNQYNHDKCERVKITPTNNSQKFAEFPHDLALKTFDSSDRKFVAVALKSSNSPTILNAVDKGWWKHRAALKDNGVCVQFLCPSQFEKKKNKGM